MSFKVDRSAVTPYAEELFYREFGRQIQGARKAEGLTQEDLAKAVGVSRTTITNIEGGNQRVSLYLAITISRVLGWPLSGLSGGDGKVAESCSGCRFFDHAGFCRRLPPAVGTFGRPEDPIRFLLPEVSPDDWCGEFRRLEEERADG